MQKISISFSGYTDSAFETKAEHILASMTGNPVFTSPIPTLVEVQAAVTTYSTQLVTAAGLGRTAVAEKNKSRKKLELLLSQLGMYVMYLANGDAAILTSSGFSLTKEPESNYITNPGNVTLGNGITSGQLQASVKAVKGAKSYLHQITDVQPAEDTVWKSTPSSRSKYIFNNLVPGKQYWVRVAATASGEQVAYSPVVSQFAQ